MPHHDKRDVIVDLLRADVGHQVGNDAVLDVVGTAVAVTTRAFAKALEPEQVAVRSFCFCDPVGMQHDDIAGVEAEITCPDERSDVAFEAYREAGTPAAAN